ncbi:hypothetical protein F5884DRAFT_663352 [Xylogone sp. PMI_703]|nr:hypothetical protein F5884DRAFT_663352 [Xylogone sp. PMI_703]
MSAKFQPEFTSEFQEFDTPGVSQKAVKTIRMLDTVRLGLTVLGLLAGVIIMGVSADTLYVYNTTHLGPDYFLALWPSKFNIQPTVALVVCGTIVFVVSAISLICSKTPAIRTKPLAHQALTFITPTINLIAGIIGTSFFYGVNASSSTYSLKSWTCQWSGVGMSVKPHWGTLCKESKAATYLMVMIIPLEVLVLSVAAVSLMTQKKQQQDFVPERKGSPAMS